MEKRGKKYQPSNTFDDDCRTRAFNLQILILGFSFAPKSYRDLNFDPSKAFPHPLVLVHFPNSGFESSLEEVLILKKFDMPFVSESFK